MVKSSLRSLLLRRHVYRVPVMRPTEIERKAAIDLEEQKEGSVELYEDENAFFNEATRLLKQSKFRLQHHAALLLREDHVSLELLNPSPECHTRKSSAAIATMGLVTTVCGGGVLSLPLVFSRAGILPTTLLMTYVAVTTDFSLYLLVVCARRSGGRTYGDVAQAAFGSAAQLVTTVTLAGMLCGSLIAYQVLVRDVWTPVLFSLCPPLARVLGVAIAQGKEENIANGGSGSQAPDILLGCILLMALPLLLKRDLHALRFTCYIGFGSCVLLMAAVVYRAIRTPAVTWQTVNWYSTDIADWLFAYPIVALCFFCSYNVLSVHASLVEPTRRRLRAVLDRTMIICWLLFYAVGLGGYLFAGDATKDNILLNFALSDPAAMAGRVGFCLTLMFGLPLILLPCREAAVSIPEQFRAWRYDHILVERFKQVADLRNTGAHLVLNGVDFDEREPVDATEDPKKLHGTMLTYGTGVLSPVVPSKNDGTVSTADEFQESRDVIIEGTSTLEQDKDTLGWAFLAHLGSTVTILASTYTVAIIVPGVSAVWSIFGSSMAIWIAFIVPTACYLKIREHKGFTIQALAAWFLLLASCISAVVCTRQAIANAI